MTRTASIASTTATAVNDDCRSVLSGTSTLKEKGRWSSKLTLDGGSWGKSDGGEAASASSDLVSTFTFGEKQVKPLVRMDQLQSHLKLLSAFNSIREQCFGKAARAGKDGDLVWTTYLVRAKHRFSVYLDKVLTWENVGVKPDRRSAREMLDLFATRADEVEVEIFNLSEELLPPLDVAMMWHAYRLNPARLLEDSARVASRRILSRVNFPLEQLSSRLNLSAVQLESKPAETFWTGATTAMPFHLVPTMPEQATEGLSVQCPICCTAQTGPLSQTVSWEELASSRWRFQCQRCGVKVNENVLKGQQYFQDVQEWLKDNGKDDCFRMRGGLLSARNAKFFTDDPHAPVLCRLYDYSRVVNVDQEGMHALLEHPPKKSKANTKGVVSEEPYDRLDLRRDFEEARGDIGELSKATKFNTFAREAVLDEKAAIDLRRRVSLLFMFYMDGDAFSPCSVELVEAVKRQFSFVEEMHGMGWTESDQRQKRADDSCLAKSIVRYHKWLNMLLKEKELLCPTLDIDLAWHTHQLDCSYQLDCFRTLGFFVDHDDKIEVTTLGTAFDQTGRLWYNMYKQPYSVCGCAVHSGSLGSIKTSIGSALGKIKGKRAQRGQEEGEEESRDQATHPSNHNMVVAKNYLVGKRTSERRLHKEERDMDKGRRANDHGDVFIHGFGRTPLEPFRYVPGARCDKPGSCSTGQLTSSGNSIFYEVGTAKCVGITGALRPDGKGRYVSTERRQKYGQMNHYTSDLGYYASINGPHIAPQMFSNQMYNAPLVSMAAMGPGFGGGLGGGGCGGGGGGGGCGGGGGGC